jgi:hypothetical protein
MQYIAMNIYFLHRRIILPSKIMFIAPTESSNPLCFLPSPARQSLVRTKIYSTFKGSAFQFEQKTWFHDQPGRPTNLAQIFVLPVFAREFTSIPHSSSPLIQFLVTFPYHHGKTKSIKKVLKKHSQPL